MTTTTRRSSLERRAGCLHRRRVGPLASTPSPSPLRPCRAFPPRVVLGLTQTDPAAPPPPMATSTTTVVVRANPKLAQPRSPTMPRATGSRRRQRRRSTYPRCSSCRAHSTPKQLQRLQRVSPVPSGEGSSRRQRSPCRFARARFPPRLVARALAEVRVERQVLTLARDLDRPSSRRRRRWRSPKRGSRSLSGLSVPRSSSMVAGGRTSSVGRSRRECVDGSRQMMTSSQIRTSLFERARGRWPTRISGVLVRCMDEA